jgi:hypothetical protein
MKSLGRGRSAIRLVRDCCNRSSRGNCRQSAHAIVPRSPLLGARVEIGVRSGWLFSAARCPADWWCWAGQGVAATPRDAHGQMTCGLTIPWPTCLLILFAGTADTSVPSRSGTRRCSGGWAYFVPMMRYTSPPGSVNSRIPPPVIAIGTAQTAMLE